MKLVNENIKDILKSKDKSKIIEDYINKSIWEDDVLNTLLPFLNEHISVSENEEEIRRVLKITINDYIDYLMDTWMIDPDKYE